MSDNKPAGIRPPNYLYEMALARVEDLMMQAMQWPKIVATLVDEGYTDSADTCDNWKREVMRRWAVEDSLMRPARKDLWRARLELLYSNLLGKAEAAHGYAQAQLFAEAIRVAKLAIVLDGVQAPVVVKHEGQIDVHTMAPHERAKEIEILLAKRAAALKAAPPTKPPAKGAN